MDVPVGLRPWVPHIPWPAIESPSGALDSAKILGLVQLAFRHCPCIALLHFEKNRLFASKHQLEAPRSRAPVFVRKTQKAFRLFRNASKEDLLPIIFDYRCRMILVAPLMVQKRGSAFALCRISDRGQENEPQLFPAVLIHMSLTGFIGVISCVKRMAAGCMSMMGRFLMVRTRRDPASDALDGKILCTLGVARDSLSFSKSHFVPAKTRNEYRA